MSRMRPSSSGVAAQPEEGEQRCINSELWHACAGPLVSLPAVGSRVAYFPQGHSEQVAASTNREVDGHVPNYPSLPSQLICQLHNVTMHADVETDEVYAQMTLQPLSLQEQKDPFLPVDLGVPSKQPTNYFCKTLTASDTSTHGGFSVPRRAAEKVFPPLDFSQQPPAQELTARDLHDNEWKFRHIFRGQPKRHLLTTGWSVFVSAKRLVAGDSVLFIWNENNQLLLGIRRTNRPQTVMPSSVLSSDSMHIGLLAAAAHAAATNSRFTIFYNPRASPSEFVIPLAKYAKAVFHTRVTVGMRFRMLFETEDSSVRRYMGTITGISDLDPVRWPKSHWRSVKVGWDESTAGERQPRVSLWEVEPLTTFPMYPSPFPLRLKRPWPSGMEDHNIALNPSLTWFQDGGARVMQPLNFQGLGIAPLVQQPRLDASMVGLQPDVYQAMAAAALQEIRTANVLTHAGPAMLQFQPQNTTSSSTPLLPGQMLHQMSQPQHNLLQAIQETKDQNHIQSQFLQRQLQNCHLFSDLQHQPSPSQHQHCLQPQQQWHQQVQWQQSHPQIQPCHMPDQQIPSSGSSVSQMASASQSQPPTSEAISPYCQQQNFPGTTGNTVPTSAVSAVHRNLQSFSPDETSNLLNISRARALVIPNSWSSKRLAVESSLLAGGLSASPNVEELGPPLPNVTTNSVTLLPFSGRECSVDQESNADQQTNLLFGVNIDSSAPLVHNGFSNLHTVGNEADSTAIPYGTANFLRNTDSDFGFNQGITSCHCLEDSGFVQSHDNVGEMDGRDGSFVKVYKSGSFGRSLDISKFSSYHELRSELGRLFGLEGQLDDPLRSGWQLVFVDQENDVLLVGDDPWQEFVSCVWCIKILSPQEVQQMGEEGVDLLNPSVKRLSKSSCDGYVSRQNSKKLSTGIASIGAFEF